MKTEEREVKELRIKEIEELISQKESKMPESSNFKTISEIIKLKEEIIDIQNELLAEDSKEWDKLALIAKMGDVFNEVRDAYPNNSDEEILCIVTGFADRKRK